MRLAQFLSATHLESAVRGTTSGETQPLDQTDLQIFIIADCWTSRMAGLPSGVLNPTRFGLRLLAALTVCEDREPGLGRRLLEELAAIKYVPLANDEAGWKAGFEQLIQKFAEVLVARLLCEAPWPEGTRIECEPQNRVTGARPEFAVRSPERTWLFEVKCPAFIKYQAGRRANPAQLPVRSFLRDLPMLQGTEVTLPRDNVLKDFLAMRSESSSI